MLPQQYCLRWKYHHSNLQTMFSQLLDRGCFCDVTLACEGQLIRAHRVVLCACSTFFDTVLTNYATEKDPIIIMKDAKFMDVKCLIEFMYKGEINVEHCHLTSLLKTAEDLKIKGLAEVSWRDEEVEPTIHPEASLNIPEHNSMNHHMLEPTTELLRPHKMPILTPIPAASMDQFGIKRKRGRPPLDDSYETFNSPKISHIERPPPPPAIIPEPPIELVTPHDDDRDRGNHNQAEDDDHDLRNQESTWASEHMDASIESESDRDEKPIITPQNLPTLDEEFYDQEDRSRHHDETDPINNLDDGGEISEDQDTDANIKAEEYDFKLTASDLEQWKDVVKMDAYLAKGRRPQFWEEPFTRRVLEAIKEKKLEMKKAARVLGVSYGTLYGRYREVYGCLKHPYRGAPMMSSRYEVWPTGNGKQAPGTLASKSTLPNMPKEIGDLWLR